MVHTFGTRCFRTLTARFGHVPFKGQLWAAGELLLDDFLASAIMVSVSFLSRVWTVSMYLVMIGIISCIASANIAGISRNTFAPVGVE